jgi:prepilin-type N-terminal cleavage/methylation domain-containing protein
MKKNGFTLVELSIVLVIIGLLIGGILAAQSMISTAKNQKVVRQISQFDIAIANFNSKFGGLPGDSSKLGCTDYGDNTCDNGLIEDHTGDAGYHSGESGKFWYDLSVTSGIKNSSGGDYTNCSAGCDVEVGVNIPKIEFKEVDLVVCGSCGMGVNKNFYSVADHSDGLSSPFASSGSMTPNQALAIDIKLDDGQPAGRVLGYNFDGRIAGQDDGNCIVSGAYNLSNTNNVCNFFAELGISNSAL